MGHLNRVAEQYVCVYVPEFPAQARLRLRFEESKSPVAVLEGEPPLQRVCSANRHARRQGVTDGMTRAELDAFPGVAMLPRSMPEETAAQNALLSAASVFTPRAQCWPSGNSFAFVLDVMGTGSHLWAMRSRRSA